MVVSQKGYPSCHRLSAAVCEQPLRAEEPTVEPQLESATSRHLVWCGPTRLDGVIRSPFRKPTPVLLRAEQEGGEVRAAAGMCCAGSVVPERFAGMRSAVLLSLALQSVEVASGRRWRGRRRPRHNVCCVDLVCQDAVRIHSVSKQHQTNYRVLEEAAGKRCLV